MRSQLPPSLPPNQTRRAVIKSCTKIYRKVDFTILQRGELDAGGLGGGS